MFQFLILSGLLSGILAIYARSKQFFPGFLPNFLPDRNLLIAFFFIWFCLAFLRFIYNLYSKYSEEIDHSKVFWFLLLSGLLSYLLAIYARSKQFFPGFLPNFLPDRNLLIAFFFIWFCLAFLSFIYSLYSKYSEEIDHSKVFWFLLLSGLLSYLLSIYARSKQFFPGFLPNFLPDRNLLIAFFFIWFCLAFLSFIYSLYSKYSEEIDHSKVFWFLLLSGLLSYLLSIYARSKQFFPNFLPNFIPDRNLLNVFLFIWFCLAFLGFIYSLIRLSSSRDECEYSLLSNDYDDNYFDYYHARNNIAHRADAYNPISYRFNPSSQYGSGGRTARWSHLRASRNNEIVRNWVNFV